MNGTKGIGRFSGFGLLALWASASCFAPAASAALTQPWTYVMAWSPQYCNDHPGEKSQPQCADVSYFMPRALVAENAYALDNCQPTKGLTESQVTRLMPLVGNRKELITRWRKEGGCVEVPFDQYAMKFDYVSRRVSVPEAYQQMEERQYFQPDEIRQQFLEANPGLPAMGIALHCVDKELSEVSICLNSNMTYRECAMIQDDCTGRTLVRGARLARFKKR
jgi:ribonuclease T2